MKSQDLMPFRSRQVDITDQILKLGKLKEMGIITEQEFESKKKDLLAKL